MDRGEELRDAIRSAQIGMHSARLDRVLLNLLAELQSGTVKPQDDRLLHIVSRVGEFSRPLAEDLRNGTITVEEAATLLEHLGRIGRFAFEKWMGH